MAVTVGRTLLKQFLEARKAVLTQAAAAQQIGISPGQLVYYLQGTQRPKQAVAERIEKWSGGEVSADSWLTDDEKVKLAAVERAPAPAADDKAAATPEPEVKTPPASPVAKSKSEPPSGPPADAFEDENTTTRDARPLPAVSLSERDRKDTQDDDRGEELLPSQVEAHPELQPGTRVYEPDAEHTPTPAR